MTAPTALPYGLRDIKLTRYVDEAGTILDTVAVDLPNAQTLSFSEVEEFAELRGDDRLVAVRGQGSEVELELESGGIRLEAWQIFTGGSVIETGIAPNRRWVLRKRSTQSRPYFKAEGRVISDSGGDVHAVIYRARITDNVEGEFTDGEFFMTSAGGRGLPLLEEDNDLIYDIVINEALTPLTTTARPNPPGPPGNFAASAPAGASPAATVDLSWTATPNADSYNVYRRKGSDAFAAGTPASVAAPTVAVEQTGLDTGTWQFYVTAVVDDVESAPSAISTVIVP